jgi:Family of unknown function (DUF5684)
MNARPAHPFRKAWLLTPLALLFPASIAFAQDDRVPWLFLGAFLYTFLLIGLAAYVYMSLALQVIANKTNTPNGWLAWIPIANAFLLVMIAKKPLWWLLLFLIPVVNLVILVMLWMGVAEARNKPNWWGILIIVPVANLIVPGYLAWAD